MATYSRQVTRQLSDDATDTSVRFQTYMKSDEKEPPSFTLSVRMIVQRAGLTDNYDMSEVGDSSERAVVRGYLKKALRKQLDDNGYTPD